jgi:hypothetical protein
MTSDFPDTIDRQNDALEYDVADARKPWDVRRSFRKLLGQREDPARNHKLPKRFIQQKSGLARCLQALCSRQRPQCHLG